MMMVVDVEAMAVALGRVEELSERVTGTLELFGERLTQLEQAMLPIHETTQRLTRLHDSLGEAGEQVERVLSYFELGGKVEQAVERGVVVQVHGEELSGVRAYGDLVRRLQEAVSFLTQHKARHSERTLVRLNALLRKACASLDDRLLRTLNDIAHAHAPHTALTTPTPHAHAPSLDALVGLYGLPDAGQLGVLVEIARCLNEYESDPVVNKDAPPISAVFRTYAGARSKFLTKALHQLHSLATGSHAASLATVVNEQRAIKGSDAKLTSSSPDAATSHTNNTFSYSTAVYNKGSHPFIAYSRALHNAIYLEFLLLQRLLPGQSGPFGSALDAILAPLLNAYQECADAIIQRAKKTAAQTQDYSAIFVLYDIVEAFLNDLQSPQWYHVEVRQSESSNMTASPSIYDSEIGDIQHQSEERTPGWLYALKNYSPSYANFFSRVLTQFTIAAARSFPDVLDSLSANTSAASSLPPPEDGTVHEISSHTISWMRRIIEWSDIIEVLLVAVKDKKTDATDMDLTEPLLRVRQTSTRSSDDWSGTMLRRYFSDVIQTLCKQLESKSKQYAKKTYTPLALADLKSSTASSSHPSIIAHIFLLNNDNFITKSVRAHSRLLSILGPDSISVLDVRVKTHLSNYLATWIPVTEPICISIPRDPSPKEKDHIKETYKHFVHTFDDLVKVHMKWTITDVELRGVVVGEVKKVVVGKYVVFSEAVMRSTVAGSVEKYVKSGKSVTESVEMFFDPRK